MKIKKTILLLSISDLLQIYEVFKGKVNQKIDPWGFAFFTPTSPFKLFTRFFTIARPKPLPFSSVALASAVL